MSFKCNTVNERVKKSLPVCLSTHNHVKPLKMISIKHILIHSYQHSVYLVDVNQVWSNVFYNFVPCPSNLRRENRHYLNDYIKNIYTYVQEVSFKNNIVKWRSTYLIPVTSFLSIRIHSEQHSLDRVDVKRAEVYFHCSSKRMIWGFGNIHVYSKPSYINLNTSYWKMSWKK